MVLKALPARSPKVTVTDAYLKPLAGVKVYATATYGLKSLETCVGVTNLAGELTVPAVYPGGRYTFRAALLGYCPAGTKLPVVGSENWMDLVEMTMEPATSVVRGKVVDGNGKAVAGARVSTDFGPSALTDSRGEFALRQMPSSPTPVMARKGSLKGSNVDAKGRIPQASETVIVVR